MKNNIKLTIWYLSKIMDFEEFDFEIPNEDNITASSLFCEDVNKQELTTETCDHSKYKLYIDEDHQILDPQHKLIDFFSSNKIFLYFF